MSERQLLIQRLKHLIQLNDIKQQEYQKKYNTGPECGFLTKEACLMVSLVPQMRNLDITFKDIEEME